MEKEIINALEDLKEAFFKLVIVWAEDNKDLLNNSQSIELYPFDKSFDELFTDVCEWVDKTTEELKNKEEENQ